QTGLLLVHQLLVIEDLRLEAERDPLTGVLNRHALASRLPLSLAGGVQLLRHADSPARLRPALVLGIAAAVLHGLGLAAGFWWT
ncbi:MAG: hypothetical protein HUU13_16715, partial [Burkholderiaceae bacterium]|nr:hypothetical protein [Burkholderiaceae bacterium]